MALLGSTSSVIFPQTMCRICLRPDPVVLWSLFERTIVGRPAAEVLSIVGEIPVHPADRFPQVCCSDCLQRLEAAFELREMVQESNRKLAEMLAGVDVGRRDQDQVVVKQELDDAGVEAGSSGSTIVENYKISMVEMPPQDYGCEPSSSAIVKSEPMDEEEPPSEEVTTQIKQEITFEEPCIQEPEESSSETEKVNPRSFFEDLPVKPTMCCGCRLNCASMEELQVHLQTVHAPTRTPKADIKKGLLECEQCYKLIRSKNGHRPLNLRCKLCGEMFTKWYGATLHYKSKHAPGKSPEPKICCGCQEKFETVEELKLHANVRHYPGRLPHDEMRPFVCEICYKNYPDYTGLHQHQRRLTQDSKPHKCSQCERSFFFLNALRDHELAHTKQKTLPCPKCSALFTNHHSLRKHIARHEIPPNKFQCATCDKSFKSQKALREHGYVHTGERPHMCTQCEASFARYDCYRAHIRSMHQGQGEQPDAYECELCGKTFRLAHYLQRHMRDFHERKSKSSFWRRQGLEYHMRKEHPDAGVGGSGVE